MFLLVEKFPARPLESSGILSYEHHSGIRTQRDLLKVLSMELSFHSHFSAR